ncbi:hypothetical protein KGQ20_06930 [Catenulispora sp. NF23]|uniref:hypothetical protein n=1 Tax=Catenulispora pinistramenti TaxID=2705254 RepID=UPI001BA6929D|nr:hypothetical protein [Catenulispora pinistramenti]MBS2532502.1 hypothetical protein [Catenulispora pinistramenti]
MSATGSNENQNSTGPDPDGSRADRARRPAASGPGGFADLAGVREAILRAERGTPAGAAGAPAGPEALLDALRRSRRVGGTPAGGSSIGGAFALDAGPEPEPDSEPPLRSRGGGVNKPRAVVPTPLLAAEAVRLVDTAHSKRARMVTAIGLPAVFLAATGVAVMPTVANAASSSSSTSTSPTSTSCAPGSSAVPNTGGAKSSAPTSAPSSTPSSAAGKPSSAPSTPGAPQPSGGSSTPKPSSSAPQSKPSGAPSGAPNPVTPTPTGANTGPTAPPPSASASKAPSSAPSSTPSPSSSVTWWNPLSWLGTTVNGVFNPAPSSSPSTVNKLAAAPAATPSSNPTSSPAPILSIGLGGSTSPSPSGTPSSKPSVPSTPQPSSSESSKPSAPSSTPSTPTSSSSSTSGASSPSSVPSGVPTYQGHVLTAPTTVCVQSAAAQPFREVEWHLSASSLTLTNQKFLGFQKIQTGDGQTVTVMAIHADSIDLTDMVTYNEDGNVPILSDGGRGQNVHLTNVTLHVLKQVGTMTAPLPLGPVTLGPPGEAGTDLISQAVMALLQLNLPLPPSTFTHVDVDQYMLTSDTLDIPGFNVEAPILK